MSRKNEDQEYVEASTSAATVLPGVPLPVWTHLGEPEPEPTPEPEPAPVPEPASVMELVSVGSAAASTDHLQSGPSDLGAASAPVAMTAPPMTAPPVTAPPMPAPPVAAGLVSVSGVVVPDSLDAFAPPVALVAPAPVEPVAAPAPPELAAPSFAAPAPMAAPPAAFAPPVAAPAVDVPVLAPPMPAPDLLVAAPPAPEMPAPVMPAPVEPVPVTPPPVGFGAAPLLFSAPAPLVAPVGEVAPPAPEVPADAAIVAVPPLEAVVPETAPVFDPAAELAAVEAPDAPGAAEADVDSEETGRSRRPLVLLLVLGIVAILAAVAAFVYPGLLVAQDDPAPVAPVSQPQVVAKTATLGVPATVAGLDKLTGAPATALSAAAGSTTLSGFSTPVSAVYGKAGVPGATVIAWTAAPSSPSANIAAAFAGFETASSTAIANIAEVPVTGGLTGQMSCGSGTVNAAPATICFWADDTTFGAVTILKPVSAKDGALTAVAVRQAVETLA